LDINIQDGRAEDLKMVSFLSSTGVVVAEAEIWCPPDEEDGWRMGTRSQAFPKMENKDYYLR